MRTLKSISNTLRIDSKTNTLSKILYKHGILHKNGLPTQSQVSQGNFVVYNVRAVHGRSGSIKKRVMVTDKGYDMIRKYIE